MNFQNSVWLRCPPPWLRTTPALVLGDLLEVADDVLDRRVRPLRALEGAVDPVDICLVVLVVMDPHRLLVDVRLERRIVVRQRRNGVRHAVSSDG